MQTPFPLKMTDPSAKTQPWLRGSMLNTGSKVDVVVANGMNGCPTIGVVAGTANVIACCFFTTVSATLTCCAGAQVASPGWSASTMHRPVPPLIVTMAPETEQAAVLAPSIE